MRFHCRPSLTFCILYLLSYYKKVNKNVLLSYLSHPCFLFGPCYLFFLFVGSFTFVLQFMAWTPEIRFTFFMQYCILELLPQAACFLLSHNPVDALFSSLLHFFYFFYYHIWLGTTKQVTCFLFIISMFAHNHCLHRFAQWCHGYFTFLVLYIECICNKPKQLNTKVRNIEVLECHPLFYDTLKPLIM